MKRYTYTAFNENKESFEFYKTLSKKELVQIMNMKFDEINHNLIYYAKLLKEIFKEADYDEHYYNLLSLCEEISDIKIIVNILKGNRYHD